MSFQGFTRDERFSDNQINIDIQSVINSDFREAERQSKYMSRNSELEQNWRSIYASAKSSKHEAEKRNRERNFKFFMDNREEIHKQIQYNNEIKYKDAGINRHVEGLDSILGKGLLQLATSVGSAAIKKAIAESGEAEAEAEVKEQKQTQAHAERYHGEASDAQKNLTKMGYLEEYAKASAEGKIKLREYYNSQGKHQLGDIEVAYHNKMRGMETLEKLDAEFSKNNIANGFLGVLQNFKGEYNGRTVTFESLYATPHNEATVNAFLDDARTEYLETSGMGERGLPTHKEMLGIVRQQLEGELRGKVFNSKVQEARWNNTRSDNQRLETAVQNDGIDGFIDTAFNVDNPNSIAAEHGISYAVNFVKNAIKNGALNRDQLNTLYGKSFGPGIPTIWEDVNKNTARGREYLALYNHQVAREQQQHENLNNERHLKTEDFLFNLEKNLKDPQQARYLLESVNRNNSNLNKVVQGMNQEQVRRLNNLLGKASGVIPMDNVKSQAYAVQEKLFNQTFVNSSVEGTVMDILTETNQVTNTWQKKNLNKAKGAFRNWLTQEVATSGLDNPQDIMNHINNIIGDDDHKSYQRLKKMLAIKTVDEDKNPLKEPIFTYLEKHGVGNAPQETGVEQYERLTGTAYGKPLDLSEVYQTPEINSGMKPLLMRLKQGKKNGLNLQHILANHMTPFITERLKKGGLSVGMIVNEAIEHGDYKVDFQPLDANVFQDAQEIQKIEQSIPNFSKMSPALQSRLGQQIDSGQGFQLASHVPHYVTAPFGQQRSTGTHYGTDIAGAGVGAQSSVVPITITNLENSAGGGKGWQGIFQTHTNKKVEIRSLHHSELYGKIGETIQPGTAIAKVGSTGRSSGPHQHLEFYIDGKLVDGETTLPGDDKRLIDYIVGHKS